MAVKIRNRTNSKKSVRYKRKRRIRSTLEGSSARPRLSVFRSNKQIYTQLIDDEKRITLAAASTVDEEIKGKAASSIEGAKRVGTLLAKRALAKNIKSIVFDRSGYLYHGRVKALADAAREGGLQF